MEVCSSEENEAKHCMSGLNRNAKKAKLEEGMKTQGSENVQPAELVKPKGSCMQSLPTMP